MGSSTTHEKLVEVKVRIKMSCPQGAFWSTTMTDETKSEVEEPEQLPLPFEEPEEIEAEVEEEEEFENDDEEEEDLEEEEEVEIEEETEETH